MANDKKFVVKNGLQSNGDITVTGTVDGRDIATDGSKLDGIATSANLYVHPSDGVDLGAALTGANVISDVTVNTAGHVTGFATRALTAANIGAAATSHTHTASQVTDFDTEVANNSAVVLNTAKVTNVSTNLSTTAAPTTVTINSSDGTNATINAADITNAGVMTTTMYDEHVLNNAKITNVSTNLGYTTAASTGTVTSSDGTNATIPAATTSLAGLLTGADKTKLDGIEALANVTDSANVAAAGAVMESDTTTALMGFVIDEDTFVSDLSTKVPTQQSVKAYVDGRVSSSVEYKGGYDASTNTPNLDTTPSGVTTGDMYTVTVAGTFFATTLEVGDVLISEQNDPTLESHWTVVNKDLDAASIKTSYESNSNTNAFTDAQVTNLGNQSGTNTGDNSVNTLYSGLVSNVSTNLSTTHNASTVVINSSDGTNATINAATATTAGIMSEAIFDQHVLNNAKVTNVSTNLGYTTAATTGTVTSSDGTNATLPAATTSLAGLLTGADKTKLDGVATGATANAGTVTSVSGTGTVSGLTLSGTVTSSGDLTLGGAITGFSTTAHNHTLDSLSNTTITSNSAGEILKWSGTAWINNTLAEAGIQPAGSYAATSHTHTASEITDFDTEVSNNTSVVANTAKVSNVSTNLSTTAAPTTVTINSSDGTNAIIAAADITNAGVMTTTMYDEHVLNNAKITNATHTGEVTGSTALTIASNVVDADNLNVVGNGTTAQYLRSDGDGSFTWATPTDTTVNQTITLSGDATGSGTTSIVVTVADDSHNHIISNVDGLQTALDEKLATTGKAADSNLLDNLDSTYFTNASNLNAGTVADARITGVYSGITLKTDGGNTHYTTPNSGSASINDRTVFGLAQYKSDGASATGAIVFIAPTTANSIMHRMRIEGMLYTGGPTVMAIIQGYRTTGAWSNTSKINLGQTDIQIRWGVDPAGKACVILGDVGTVWSYPMLAITHAMFSHTGAVDAYCSGWTTGLVTSLTGYTQITGTLANNTVRGSFDASDLSSGILADARLSGTYTGVSITGSAAKLTTARSIALAGDVTGSANFDGSANISITSNIAANVINATELNVVGNGTTAQYLRSDGDGTFTWATPPSGGISYTRKTTTYTAVANEGVIADTTASSWTLTLPATPASGTVVVVVDGNNWATNNLTIGRNGSTIEGDAANMTMDIGGVSVEFIYDGTTWQVYAQVGANSGTVLTASDVSTNSNFTIDPTKLADRATIKTLVDAASPASYEGTNTSWAIAATPFSFTHGLGAVPRTVQVTLVCKVADGGWAVGDEVEDISDLSGIVRGIIPARSATDVFVLIRQNVYIPTKTTASYITPTSTNWNLRVRAIL